MQKNRFQREIVHSPGVLYFGLITARHCSDRSKTQEADMKKRLFTLLTLFSPLCPVFAQDPFCMWGETDITCESSRLARDYQGLKSAEEHVNELSEEVRRGFSYQDPGRPDYEPTKDACLLNPDCDVTAKGIVHYNSLYNRCVGGNMAACRKLQGGAYTPAPSDRYPGGGRMNVPYGPGDEPVPGVDPYANIRSSY
jgi:hypothetical protein